MKTSRPSSLIKQLASIWKSYRGLTLQRTAQQLQSCPQDWRWSVRRCAMKVTLVIFHSDSSQSLWNIHEVTDAKLAKYSSTNAWTTFMTGQISVEKLKG
jgi:hypothetical protein